jgi:hypothetical protein
MYEYQILVRVKKTTIRSKGYSQYANCQICNEKYSQLCVEAESSQNKEGKNNVVFVFCNDCYLVVNDICSKFVYNKNVYHYEKSYHINDKPIKKKKKCSFISHDIFPFVIGNRLIMY